MGRVLGVPVGVGEFVNGVLVKFNETSDEPSSLPVDRWFSRAFHRQFFIKVLRGFRDGVISEIGVVPEAKTWL